MITFMLRPIFLAGLLGGICAFASAPAVGTANGTTTIQGTSFTVDRYAINNGGGSASGGAFSVKGSIGQHDADPLQPSTGGVFAVTGGFFWAGTAAPLSPTIFGNGFEGQ